LHENYPNPFNPTTTLRFDLPEVSNITLTIFNMLGQKIRTYDKQSAAAGYHTLKWNATNDYGDPVGAGVYLYQLQSKDFVKTRKMVLLK
jgi:flagellar hook assembly protein FlgD